MSKKEKYIVKSYTDQEDTPIKVDSYEDAIEIAAGDRSFEDCIGVWSLESGILINTCLDGLIYEKDQAASAFIKTPSRHKERGKTWFIKVMDKNLIWKTLHKSGFPNPMDATFDAARRSRRTGKMYGVFLSSHPTEKNEIELCNICYNGTIFYSED